jgi:nucleoside-diphosphate-sugar epimerase
MPAAERDDIDINGARNVARAALTNSAQRLVHASSVAAYDMTASPAQGVVSEDFPTGRGDSPFYYANGKATVERLMLEEMGGSSSVLTFLRPTFIVGPNNRDTITSMQSQGMLVSGHDPAQQWVHEDDVARAFVQAVLEDMPGAYNVVPDDAVKMSEVLRIIGVKSPRTVPLWLAHMITGVQWRYLNGQTHPVWVDVMYVYGDRTFSNAKLRATGWQPRFSSAEALRDSIHA